MPRKSSASLAVVRPTATLPRLKPARKLSPLERRVWAESVDSLPGDYFGAESRSQLEAYVGHVALAAMLLERLSESPVDADWLKLCACQVAQSKAAAAYARSLRLTTQSRLDKTVAATKSKQGGPATLETLRLRYAAEADES